MNAIQLRRAKAKAAGKCGTCCKRQAIAGLTTCIVCYQRSRKSHGRGPTPTPGMSAAERRVVFLSTAFSRARRRCWIAAHMKGWTPIERIVREAKRAVGKSPVPVSVYGTREHDVRAHHDAKLGVELRRRLKAAGLVDTAPFDVEADRREELLALTELSLMRRVSP